MEQCIRWAFRYGRWAPSREEWLTAARMVQAEERERIARFHFQADAKAAMSGRLLIRRAIRQLSGMKNNEIYLTRTPEGRPVLQVASGGVAGFDFNLSHQGGMAVLAAAPRARVGADVMLVEPARGTRSVEEFFRLMDRQFGAEEWQCIREGADDLEQMRRFYRHWCLKESFVKAVGTGISYELKRLRCLLKGLSENGPSVLSPEPDPDNWHFEEHSLGDDFVAGIAWRRADKPEEGTFVELGVSDLLAGDPLTNWLDDSVWSNFGMKEAGKVL